MRKTRSVDGILAVLILGGLAFAGAFTGVFMVKTTGRVQVTVLPTPVPTPKPVERTQAFGVFSQPDGSWVLLPIRVDGNGMVMVAK